MTTEARTMPTIAALVPLALTALCDPEARGLANGGRDVVVGLSLALDRSFALPIGQLLAPLATLVPLGPIELRAAIALAIPAALATYLVARRIEAATSASAARGGSAIAFAFAATVGVLLGTTSPGVALAVVAIEVFCDTTAPRSLPPAALMVAIWAAPRLAPALVVAAFVMRERRDRRWTVLGAVPLLGALGALLLLRQEAWLSFGHAFQSQSFARAPQVFPEAAALRAAVVLVVLGLITRVAVPVNTAAARQAPIVGASAIAASLILGAPGGLIVAAACLAPLAVLFAGALSIAVERHLATAGRTVLTLLVPALALGLGARAFEVELGERRLGQALAAHDLAAIVTVGIAAPRSVLIIEDEASLLRFAHARVVHGLRPDIRVLPAQVLAAGGAARMANRTIAAVPSAVDPLRALLARGTLEPADIAPLAHAAAVLVDLPVQRVRAVARHAAATGGPLSLALERVDPSDRRLRRPGLERRLAFLATALGTRPLSDPGRVALRGAATREARVLSLAGDRDGALAAIARAGALGADPDRVARWSLRVNAKQSLESEPVTADD